MNSTPIPQNDFLKEGAYIGNLLDFISENDFLEIKEQTKKIKEHYETKKDTVMCRYNYMGEEDYPHRIPVSMVNERDIYVEKNGYAIAQKWFEFDADREQFNFFSGLCEKILSKFYPNKSIRYDAQIGGFTVYEDGHFISDHQDGENENRVCVVIIYLSNEEDYNDGGGELVIKTNSSKEFKIKPILGTFSLLDFSENNINHSVNVVKNGFKRFSFINFFYENVKNNII